MAKCWLYNNCNHKDCDKDFCLRRYKLNSLYDAALISDAQRKHITLYIDQDATDLEEFRTLADIEKNILSFVESGQNLYIHSSNCGNGKTSWSLRLVEAYMNRIWPGADLGCHALFISVPKFLASLKDNISNRNEYAIYIREQAINAELVVWDDIAAKSGSDYDMDQLLRLIDDRCANKKANIFTSNLNAREIETALGSRLASRICRSSLDVEFHGADKRGFAAENNLGGENDD